MVGFVTLFGVTLRNSILMIAHYRDLVELDGMTWNLETAVRGAADRLAAIVMTSLVTALGVLPLAIGMKEPGREIEGPMAVVILGGLITSMVLNLLVLPTLALRYGDFHPKIEGRWAEQRTPADAHDVSPLPVHATTKGLHTQNFRAFSQLLRARPWRSRPHSACRHARRRNGSASECACRRMRDHSAFAHHSEHAIGDRFRDHAAPRPPASAAGEARAPYRRDRQRSPRRH